MTGQAQHHGGPPSVDTGYLRTRARMFRHCASDEGDAMIHDELLRLAVLYDQMAAEGDEAVGTGADHD